MMAGDDSSSKVTGTATDREKVQPPPQKKRPKPGNGFIDETRTIEIEVAASSTNT
jgi:hypothetical protein